jgi:hypothetical protein
MNDRESKVAKKIACPICSDQTFDDALKCEKRRLCKAMRKPILKNALLLSIEDREKARKTANDEYVARAKSYLDSPRNLDAIHQCPLCQKGYVTLEQLEKLESKVAKE